MENTEKQPSKASVKWKEFCYRASIVGIKKYRDNFLESLAGLLVSGMSLHDGLTFVMEDIKNKTLRKIVEKMAEEIGSGISLSESMINSKIFTSHIITLVRMGESSGHLNENISIVVEDLRKSTEMNAKIRSALMYPCFVLILVLVVGIGIAWWVLPKLAQIFNGLNMEVPTITRKIIGVGEFLEAHGIIFVPCLLIAMAGIGYLLFFQQTTRIVGEIMMFKTPGIKRLLLEAEIAKFGFLFGTLLSAGLSPLTALESISKSTRAFRYKRFYEFLYSQTYDGYSLRDSFQMYPKSYKLYPSSIQQIIVSGEQSGNMSEALEELGRRYEGKIEQTTKDLSVMLEPILLVVVWLGVVGIALAVILPVYDLIGGVR